jgi:adenosylhomocysteine nucleosidase
MTASIQIAMLFALPQEYGCLKRFTAPWLRAGSEPFRSFVRRTPRQELIMLESGMGRDQMLGALKWVLGRTRPDLVIAGGFAGALLPDLKVGDVCLAGAFSTFDRQCAYQDKPIIGLRLSQRLILFCRQHRIRETRIVTVERPEKKRLLRQELGDAASTMDMESYSVARFCYENHIPFFSFRAISDGIGDEIDFDLEAISDERGRVKIPLVLASIVGNPGLVRSYFSSWKRSRKAARNLGKALTGLLHLPSTELRTLIAENHLYV